MSRPARRNLVDRDGALSIRRQCELMGISRSSVYYAPRGESAENLALEGVPPVVESQRRQEHVTPPSASRQGRHPSLRRGAPSASRDARTR